MSDWEATLIAPLRRGVRCGSRSKLSSLISAPPQTCRMEQGGELRHRDHETPGADPPTEPDDPLAFPMSSGQSRAWFTEQVTGPSAANNICLGLRVNGTLDTAALALGLRIVTGRHEILRTTFDVISGRPVQLVHRDNPKVLTFEDLSDAPDPEQAAYSAARRVAYAPFDLKLGPLLRVSLFRLAAEQHVLFCTLHHIIADGWSLGVFVKGLAGCYAALCG